MDARLRREIDAFSLRFACEDCCHFSHETERCVHGYPSDAHRLRSLEGSHLAFCKEFELAEDDGG